MPIDGFFEWKDIHGTGKNKKPYAIAMKDGRPFALAAIWESWRDRTRFSLPRRKYHTVLPWRLTSRWTNGFRGRGMEGISKVPALFAVNRERIPSPRSWG